MKDTEDVTGGKPIAVGQQFITLRSIAPANTINPLVLLRHLWKKERGAIL
jgi:hypothetical protein